MVERTPERIDAEARVTRELASSQKHALLPLVISTALALFDKKKASEYYTTRLAPSKKAYHAAIEHLQYIDQQEGFSSAALYINHLRDISSSIPPNLRQTAYYPFAGTDIFWAAVFNRVVMEDINYDAQHDNPEAWWSIKDYSTRRLRGLLLALQEQRLVPPQHDIRFLIGDSENKNATDWLNTKSTTLIYKSGHTFSAYVRQLFQDDDIKFGAIVISNDSSNHVVVERQLEKRQYKKVFELQPTDEQIPWTLPLTDVTVFTRP